MSTAYPPIPYDGSDLPRSPSGGGAPIMQTEIDGARPAMRSISPGRDHQSMRLRRKNTAGSDSLSYDMRRLPSAGINGRPAFDAASMISSSEMIQEEPRLMLEFSFKEELFHAMVSYRASTEGSRNGNHLALELCQELHVRSMTSHPLPNGAQGKWPSFATPPDLAISVNDDMGSFEGGGRGSTRGGRGSVRGGSAGPQPVKVFLDEKCLLTGENWLEGSDGMGGIVGGVLRAVVFVPILSWPEDGQGSVGALLRAHESGKVDNVLLELILALEFFQCPMFATRAILPILVGRKLESGLFDHFPMDRVKELPGVPAEATNREAFRILYGFGISIERLEEMQRRSVRKTVELILTQQGIQLADEGSLHKGLTAASCKILDAVMREYRGSKEPATFEFSKPQGREVLDWLRSRSLWMYASLFAEHSIDSLFLAARLTRAEIDEVVEEFHNSSVLHKTGSRISHRLRLEVAVEDLRGQDVAKPLQQQLDEFTDKEVSNLTAMIASSGMEVALSKPLARYMMLFLGAIALAGAYVGAESLVQSGLPNIAGRDPELEYMSNYSSVIHVIVLVLAGVFAIVLHLQARFQSPMAAKRTLRRCLHFATILCTIAVVTDVVQTVEYHRLYGFVDIWFVFFSLGFWLSMVVLMGVYYLAQRFFILIFLGLLGSWVVLVGLLMMYLDRFNYTYASNAILCLMAGGALCSFALFLLVLYVLGERKAKLKAERLMKKYELAYNSINDSSEKQVIERMASTTRQVEAVLHAEFNRYSRWKTWYHRMANKGGERLRYMPSGKIAQRCEDLDQLYSHATAINDTFHDMIAEWISYSNAPGELVRGPIKQPRRAIQKCFRSYRRDPRALTDLVRCTVLFPNVSELWTFVEPFLEQVAVGLQAASAPDSTQPLNPTADATQRNAAAPNVQVHGALSHVNMRVPDPASLTGALHRGESTGFGARSRLSRGATGRTLIGTDITKMMRVTGLKNRLDPLYDPRSSAGFRGLSMNLEVGWTVDGEGATVMLEVDEWTRTRAEVHICELQLLLKNQYDAGAQTDSHATYVKWRNMLGR